MDNQRSKVRQRAHNIVCWFLACLMSLMCFGAISPERAYAAGNTGWYFGHEGDSSYVLTSADQLAGLADLVNSGTSFAGKTINLGVTPNAGVSLYLTGEWTPIGTKAHPFNGIFEGNGSSISNLNITRGIDGIGLFGYAGTSSQIKNITVSGSINLTQPATSTAVIKNVGGIVGYTNGSVSNCASSVNVKAYSQVAATKSQNTVIENIGAIGGVIRGAVSNCSTTARASVNTETTAAPVDIDTPWVIANVGGIVGTQGAAPTDLAALKDSPAITSCTNAAPIRVLCYAQGVNDRFGNPTYAAANFAGGIAGYSTGSISSCRNSGNIDSAYLDAQGKAQPGYGCRGVGGIVGGHRVDYELTTATDDNDPGLRYNLQYKEAIPIVVSDCVNTATIFGMAQSGGIVGQGGSWTTIVGSYNTGMVEASRFTKPSPGGIVGRTYGNISYCYNTGMVVSTTGAGYYAAGIVGMLHTIGTDYAGNQVIPEMYACYNTGHIETSDALYRAGALVGELEGGYIHDCFALENLCYRNDISGLDNPTGTITNTSIIKQSDALAASSIAMLNACAPNDGWKHYFALPQNAVYGQVINIAGTIVGPAILKGSYESAIDLAALSGIVTVTRDASYSASSDPIPTVSVALSSGKTLVQGADFRVVPQAASAGLPVGSACTGQIEGIGIYKGTFPVSFNYKIIKGPISQCSISAEAKYFNWSKQKPDVVILRDALGNVVDSSEYTWTVDEALFNNASSTAYVNAFNETESKYYPIIVTANSSGNYEGTQTANCFKIRQVGFASNSVETGNPNQDTLIGGQFVWGNQTWNFDDVTDFNANGGMGNQDKRGVMRIKYTGSPIKPTLTGITYMGRALKEIKDGDPWYNAPKNWGYMVLYGNPNPETGSDGEMESDDESVTNATHGDDYAVITVRSAPQSNFTNYVNIWFAIEPADLSTDVAMGGTFHDTVAWNGLTAEQNDVQFTYNGMTLQPGRDYVAKYEKGPETGQMTVTFTGVGNYAGSITRTYNVTGTQAGFTDIPENEWYIEDGSLEFVTTNGIMSGLSGTTLFDPYGTVTRGQAATVLYRIATGSTAESTDNYVQSPFSDVATGQWYTAAVAWAQQKGVVTGYSGTTLFGPNDLVTREQLAVMIARFAQCYGISVAVDPATVFSPELANTELISDWAINGVAWCVSQGILNNFGNLDPLGFAQRVQLAKILRVAWNDVLFINESGQLMTLGELVRSVEAEADAGGELGKVGNGGEAYGNNGAAGNNDAAGNNGAALDAPGTDTPGSDAAFSQPDDMAPAQSGEMGQISATDNGAIDKMADIGIDVDENVGAAVGVEADM